MMRLLLQLIVRIDGKSVHLMPIYKINKIKQCISNGVNLDLSPHFPYRRGLKLSLMLWLNIILLIVAVGLITVILLQNRSAGLGGAFGGAGGEGFHVRRGSEKQLFQLTVILGGLFLIIAIAHLFI